MKALFANLLALLLFAVAAMGVRAADIAVVISSDATVYQEALEGFREVVGHRISSVQTLKDNPAGWRDELKKLRSVIEPDLVFVVGTSALQAVANEITNIPIVHALVFNPASSINFAGKNVTGVAMNPSANQVFSLVKELNPKYRRVGAIFDPSRRAPLVSQARSVAQKEGIQLVTREIQSAGEIGTALTSLEHDIDVLWLWPDERFLADDILQRIFLFSFDRKIPVLGLSERHTQMGAVLSLSYASAKDIGRQAGEAVNKLITEPKSMALPNIALRQLKLTANLKTARKVGVDIPDSIIRRADNAVKAPVYKEGDWWVFRIRTLYPDGKIQAEDHRVAFKNGKLESDDPIFLTGADLRSTPSFLPFASVYVSDPRRNWLNFPLLPGKTWSFRYLSASYVRSRPRWTLANAEVIGKTSNPIVTPAGTFEAIEISRSDYLTPTANLTYFYSSQTRSVVKLKAEIDPWHRESSGRRFELELIAYGNETTEKKDVR
jgi:putative ABC transport system substrate-binding protein